MNDNPTNLIYAYLDGDLTDVDRCELDDWLGLNTGNVDRFVADCRIHSELCDKRWGEARGMAGFPAIDLSVGATDQLLHQPDVEPLCHLDLESQISSSPFPTLSPVSFSHSSPFVGSPVFSYMVAVAILGVMLLFAWMYNITHHYQVGKASSPMASSIARPEMVFVGRITGMNDCRWSDPRTECFAGASVPLGRKYALASGLMQITYLTGVKVILEGPCIYEVESSAGGFLSLGKLIAKVVNKRSGVGGQRSNHHPLFSVRTPSAIVTDLGTEFGVEVDRSGNCATHVFEGRVVVGTFDSMQPERTIELGTGDSARMELGSDKIVVVHLGSAAPERFSRHIPHQGPVYVFNTGRRVKHGTPDPHWRITAAVNQPDFVPQPAIVTLISSKYFRRNLPLQSQWISTADKLPELPEGEIYTFQTTFELNGSPLKSMELRGAFAVDNHVDAIRFNGQPVAVPEHGYSQPFWDMHSFSVIKGFVEGTNVLEFDVRNGSPTSKHRYSLMAFLVELEVVLNAGHDKQEASSDIEQSAAGGKEGDQ